MIGLIEYDRNERAVFEIHQVGPGTDVVDRDETPRQICDGRLRICHERRCEQRGTDMSSTMSFMADDFNSAIEGIRGLARPLCDDWLRPSCHRVPTYMQPALRLLGLRLATCYLER